jgi:hypothetical protein
MQRAPVLASVLALLAAPTAFAGTINVPADYPTIQQAINAAVNGDVVKVAAGTFFENINFKGKAITVQGVGRRPQSSKWTLIDGSNGGPCVTMANGETPASVLKDLELRNGTGRLKSGKRYGGGLYLTNSASPTIDNVGIGFNTAYRGGGVYFDKACKPTFIDSLFANNWTANKGSGGGVHAIGTATFDTCRWAHNVAPNGTGGAVYLDGNDSVFIDCEVVDNYALYAGGIHVHGGAPSITGTVFQQNDVTSAPVNGEGGGLYIGAGAKPWVSGNEFLDNKAHTGAGIYSYDSSPSIVGNLIHDNTAFSTAKGFGFGAGVALGKSKGSLELNEIYYNTGVRGGGVSIRGKTSTLLLNNVVDHNDVGSGVGGGIYSKDSKSAIVANTIADNSASKGGGLYIEGSAAPAMDTSIVWGNVAPADPSYFDATALFTFGFSDIQAAAVGGSSLSVDPLFVDPTARNYRLGVGSPVVDAGNFAFGGGPNDIYGSTRIVGGRVDMGAAEQ